MRDGESCNEEDRATFAHHRPPPATPTPGGKGLTGRLQTPRKNLATRNSEARFPSPPSLTATNTERSEQKVSHLPKAKFFVLPDKKDASLSTASSLSRSRSMSHIRSRSALSVRPTVHVDENSCRSTVDEDLCRSAADEDSCRSDDAE